MIIVSIIVSRDKKEVKLHRDAMGILKLVWVYIGVEVEFKLHFEAIGETRKSHQEKHSKQK